MNIIARYCIIVFSAFIIGCNWGHPTKTKDKINESDIIGTFQYRDEFIITLLKDGKGKQLIKDKEIEFKWKLSDNELVMSLLYLSENGIEKNLGEQQYIISKDYRDYYYPFGSPDDLDNHEVWQKINERDLTSR